MKIIKLSQSYSDSYFSGNVPDPSGNIGTSMVDVSSIASQFPDAQKSVALVNIYDSSLLRNIGYIFSFNNQSAYGVYLPGLTTEINFIELKNIRVDEGKYSLIPFLRNGNKNLLPFYLEIEKIN